MKVLSVCGGNGVFCHPLKKYLIGNIENRAIYRYPKDTQWKSNFDDIPLYSNLESAKGLISIKPDVIIGHPDCGHSSKYSLTRQKVFTKQARDNKSVQLFIGSILVFKPKMFFMENLPKYWADNESELREQLPNYEFKVLESSVTSYGNSQKTRIRALIIGVEKEYYEKVVPFLEFQNPKPLKTSGELIEGLEEEDQSICHVSELLSDTITMYSRFKCTVGYAKEVWLNNPKWDKWLVTDRPFCHVPGVYLNHYDSFPKTARKANRQFNHKGLMLSPRELARIQGVPDSFKLIYEPEKRNFYINKGRTTATKTPPYDMGLFIAKKLKIIINLKLLSNH